MSTVTSDVPAWHGNPSTYLAFEVACSWYEKTLKENERRGAAACVWSRLSGPARSVVKHPSPKEFDNTNGLDALLSSSCSPPRTSSKRREQETIPELLVREDELFLELQQSLLRSRAREKPAVTQAPSEPSADGAASPGASPSSAKKDDKGEVGEKPARAVLLPRRHLLRKRASTLTFSTTNSGASGC